MQVRVGSGPSSTAGLARLGVQAFSRAKREEVWMAMGILGTPNVQDRIQAATDHFGSVMALALRQWVEHYGSTVALFESPLEAIFFSWWWMFEGLAAGMTLSSIGRPKLWLYGQHRVDLGSDVFRLDFAVASVDIGVALNPDLREEPAPRSTPRVAIELDGHQFHERTLEQVTARNRRDRLLQAAGWTVLHISGSELHARPYHVVGETWGTCQRILLPGESR